MIVTFSYSLSLFNIMQAITPFQNTKEALAALDNGGHFFNFFTKANDGIITTPELGKVAGVFADKQQMALYLAMSVTELNTVGQEQVIYSLSPDLKSAFEQHLPLFLSPAEAAEQAPVSASAVVTGIPRRVDTSTDFKGFIIIPIMVGSVMTMMMVPILDKYDVYELHDERMDGRFLIAHARGQQKLPEQPLRVGGVIKELKTDKNEKAAPTKFLEALYYCQV
ncbi:hypothetical protein GCM10027037_32590 [Mucilaginibacter koreensis]